MSEALVSLARFNGSLFMYRFLFCRCVDMDGLRKSFCTNYNVRLPAYITRIEDVKMKQKLLLLIVKKLMEYLEGYHLAKDPVRKVKVSNGADNAKL